MNDIWHSSIRFESRDIVFQTYQKRHGRTPSAGRVRDITANFIQGREYFLNADRSAITVRPLLQYYGVLALTRGLILTISCQKDAAALKPSHGLEHHDWAGTLKNGVASFGDLAVILGKGTFWELLEATDNTSYFRGNSSAVNWKVSFPLPVVGTKLSFFDVASSMVDVSSDYTIWMDKPLLSAKMDSLTMVNEEGKYEVKFPANTKEEVLNKIFAQPGLSYSKYSNKISLNQD